MVWVIVVILGALAVMVALYAHAAKSELERSQGEDTLRQAGEAGHAPRR
ncbi:MAG TPA: hypothetical protein VLK82_15700 [Candidatus Tectomicrobia bacterium]|nr:hypothetical protein [Candidatus Tectomicrobia bacterium]